MRRLFLVALACLVVAAVNTWAADTTRYWDPAPAGESLDNQSRTVLRRVDQRLRLTMFATGEAGPQRRLLERYRLAHPKVEVSFVDPDAQPSVAQRYRIQAYGTVVVEYGQRRENALAPTEQEITSAIVRVLRKNRTTVCFTSGHGEYDVKAGDEAGLSLWARALADNGVDTRAVDLSDPEALDSCDAAVILPVAGDFRPEEVEALQRLTNRGGGVLVGVDGEHGAPSPPNLTSFVSGWGLSVAGGPVVDLTQGLASDPRTFLVSDLPIHPATAGVPGLLLINSAALEARGDDTAVLASSSEASFVDGTGDGVYTSGTADRRGRFPVVVVGERLAAPASEARLLRSRVALMGDARLFANSRFLDAGNRLLGIKIVDWLTASSEVVSIAWRPPEANRLLLTKSEERYILYVCVIAVPVVLASLGALSWLRRRRS